MSQTVPVHRSDLHWLSVLGPFVGLALVVAIFSFLTWRKGTLDDFLAWENFRLIFTHAAIIAVAGLGMTIIMITGGIDLSVGYVISLATVIMMEVFHLIVYWQPFDGGATLVLAGLAALLAGLATGTFCGLCNGLIITKLRIVPFVATLAMMGIARGVGIYFTKGTRTSFPSGTEAAGWMKALGVINPASISPDWAWMGVAPSVWSVVILALLVALFLRYTVLGRHCFAIGSNEATARLCGVRVENTKIILYSLAGLLTGWAGVLQFCRTNAGSHDVAAGMELSVIAAVVIGGGNLSGGEGTVLGTVIGALIITILDNGCGRLDLHPDLRYVVIAGIILGVAAVNGWRKRNGAS